MSVSVESELAGRSDSDLPYRLTACATCSKERKILDAVANGFASLEAAQVSALRRRAILSCAIGNFFELFDFTIYGYFAVAITRAFWRDLAIRKRRTEVDVQVLRVVDIGAEHGVDCPKSRKLTEMIHEIEDGTRPMTDDNLLELAGMRASGPRSFK